MMFVGVIAFNLLSLSAQGTVLAAEMHSSAIGQDTLHDHAAHSLLQSKLSALYAKAIWGTDK